MAGIGMRPAASLIGGLFRDGSTTGMTDEQLLERFVARDAGAESAFGAIVERHGPMVLGVCRSSLRDLHDAEDAFQATFLVLARKASSLRDPGRLGPWLHGVARRTAQKAKARRSRQERIVKQTDSPSRIDAACQPESSIDRDDDAEVLHGEINRLPQRYRQPVILCYLEGLTHEEAARQLGWPMGTLGVRLMRARERLRERLTRRGLAPASPAALAFAPRTEPLAAPLLARTVRDAIAFTSRNAAASATIPVQIKAIAWGVMRTMSIQSFMMRVMAILACGLIASGFAAYAFQAPPKRPNAPQGAAPSQKPSPEKAESKSILSNGGFERGAAGASTPESWKTGATIPGVRYHWDKTVAHGGRASLHLKKTAQRYFPIAQCFQQVNRTGKAPRLKVGAFVKAEKMTKAILDVQFITKDGEPHHQWTAYIGAKEDGDPPATHDWKWYEGVVEIPDGTQKILVAAQIYGPGDVWFDDVVAEYTDAPATDATADSRPAPAKDRDDPESDIATVAFEDRRADGDAQKRYFLIGPTEESNAPADGYRLLLLVPGGAGGADFLPFAKRIAQNALPEGYLVAELVAVEWAPNQFEDVVWPTATHKLPGVRFRTEEFVDAVIADVARHKKIDPRYVFTLGWSAGGPPVYAASLRSGTHVTGSFVAMSVFKPEQLASMKNARGHSYYILHSPQDFIPIEMAEAARDDLRREGAKTDLRQYEGGHGWHGDVYGEIRRGIAWLEANSAGSGKK